MYLNFLIIECNAKTLVHADMVAGSLHILLVT